MLNNFTTNKKLCSNDSLITSRVKDKFVTSELIDSTKIRVNTINSIVKLDGKVSNQRMYNQVINTVKSINGVEGIDPDLTIG
jgi:osmotically-inducible protein OsmY